MESNEFSFELITENNHHQLIDCVQRCFPSPNGETMAKALGLSKKEYLSFTEVVCEKAVRDGFSFLVRDPQTNVIGFCINEDFTTAPNYSSYPFNEKFLPLFAILDELCFRYLTERKVQPGEAFHLYMLGIDRGFNGAGLATKLVEGVLQFAKELGFSTAVAEGTGPASQKIMQKLGFQLKASLPYQTFQFAGKRPFEKIDNPKACIFFEKSLV